MAAADSQRCIRNAPYRAVFAIRNTAMALVSGASNLDSEIIKDSASAADLASEAVEIGTSGIYYVDITASEFTFTGDATLKVTSTEGVPTVVHFEYEPSLESGVATASAATSLTLRSTASAVDDIFNGLEVEIVRGTGQGQCRTIIDYVGSTKVCTTERAWATNPDSSSVYQIKQIGGRMGANGMLQVDIQEVDADANIPTAMQYIYQGGFVSSSVDDSTPTTTAFNGASGLSATDDFYNNATMIFVTGTNATVMREITDYVGSSRLLTVGAFPASPANGDKFVIIGKVF